MIPQHVGSGMLSATITIRKAIWPTYADQRGKPLRVHSIRGEVGDHRGKA